MLKSLLFDIEVAGVFLVMLTILVFAHELGHYLFARWFRMGAEEFAIGFGKRLAVYGRRKYRTEITEDQAAEYEAGGLRPKMPEGVALLEGATNEDGRIVREGGRTYLDETTLFTIRMLPLGGFVRVKGMVPHEDGSETRIPGGFYSKPPLPRIAVLFAGPLFSVLAGLVILIPYFMAVGKSVPVHDPVIGIIAPGPAQKAGLQVKDRILAINGQPIDDYYQVVKIVRAAAGVKLDFLVAREGKDIHFTVVPEQDASPSAVIGPDLEPTESRAIQGKIGAAWNRRDVPLGFGAAVLEACEVPVVAVAGLAHSVSHPSELKDEVGGPETMVRVTAGATSQGIGRVVQVMALLSISLGIFNLLPLAPLDGGQMVMSFAELLRGGRRLSIRAQGWVVSIGLGAVATLIVGVLYLDFMNWHSGERGLVPASPKAAKSP